MAHRKWDLRINEKIVWETLQKDLPPLVPMLKDLLRKQVF
jgi:uncharacterized protein with HEPN domain